MEALKKHKNTLFIILIIAVLFGAYTILFKQGDDGVLSVIEPQGPGVTVERELLALLTELRSIELDETIFNDPSFRSLINFSRPVPPEPVGRDNPFAPAEGTTAVNGQ